MKVSFEVDEKEYREAIARGWNREYNEAYAPSEIGLNENPIDLRFALQELDDADIKNISLAPD